MINKFKILLFFSFVVAFFSLPKISQAANYYIDYVSGDDANNGISTNTPWQHCPGDASATNNPLATILAPGDAVIFKGGVEYDGQINLNWSGSIGDQIVYDGNSAGNWGVGRAIVDGQDIRNFGFYTGSARDYITIKSFEIRNIAYRLVGNSWDPVGGIYSSATSTGWLVNNNYIHHVGYWNNDCANPLGSGGPTGAGISLIQSRDLVLSNNDITKTGGGGIGLVNPIDSIVSGNVIHEYIVWGIDISGDYGGATGNVIRGNTIYDLYHHDVGFRGGACDPHTDFIFIRQGSGVRPDGNIVEKNIFYNNYAFTDAGGTAQLFLSYADNTTIRNNVFINPHSYYAISVGWTSANTKIYNNTVYSPRETPLILTITGVDTQILNNIFVGGGAYFSVQNDESQGSLAVVDNNLFINKTAQVNKITPYTNWTLAQWRVLGFDVNSSAVSNIDDIRFKNISGYPTACETMDLRLQAGSPAINEGMEIAGFSDDKNGVVRPAGAWDIGAYEYVDNGIIAPAAPSGLSVN